MKDENKEIKQGSTKSNKKKEAWRFIKFTLFSISAGIIQIVSFTILDELIFVHNNYWVSYLISLVLSVLWNFTFNRKFTFKSANNVPKAMFLTFLFYVVFTPLSTLWTKFFTEDLQINEYIIQAGTMIINFVTEFIYQKFVVFRNSIDSAEKAKDKKENQVDQPITYNPNEDTTKSSENTESESNSENTVNNQKDN